MQGNFFVDLVTFNTIGLLTGFDFMIVFSVATFLAMLTRYFTVLPLGRILAAQSKEKGDRSALPAYRQLPNKKRRD